MLVSEDELLGKFIDRYMKKAIDNLIFKLESKYNVELSESSTLEVVLLSSDFINRISQVIESEQLREPEAFENEPNDQSGNYRYKKY